MTKFTLHWLDGRKESVEGTTIADACQKAGIGAGALVALDYFEEAGNTETVFQLKGYSPHAEVYGIPTETTL